MSKLFSSRIRKDLLEVLTTCQLSEFCSIFLKIDGDLSKWLVKLVDSETGQLEDRAIYIEISFPDGYPMIPPSVTAKVWLPHICVDQVSGDVCLDMLSTEGRGVPYSGWTPSYTGKSIF